MRDRSGRQKVDSRKREDREKRVKGREKEENRIGERKK